MGKIMDFIRGIKRPDTDTVVRSPDQVRAAILAVNRPTAPFVVREGGADEAELIGEWRIVDAEWSQVFAKAGLTKVFRVSMRLDPENSKVRAVDESWEVKWARGPLPQLVKSKSRGRKAESSWSSGYAFTEKGEFGEVYRYRFSTGELKKPLQKAVTECGWTWHSVLGKV